MIGLETEEHDAVSSLLQSPTNAGTLLAISEILEKLKVERYLNLMDTSMEPTLGVRQGY